MLNKFPICNRCQKEIEDVAFIAVQPTIILQQFFVQTPPIFKCPEHAENFTKNMIFHDDCWLAELKDHNVPIHDMTEVAKKYAKEALEKLTSSSSSSSSSSSNSGG